MENYKIAWPENIRNKYIRSRVLGIPLSLDEEDINYLHDALHVISEEVMVIDSNSEPGIDSIIKAKIDYEGKCWDISIDKKKREDWWKK